MYYPKNVKLSDMIKSLQDILDKNGDMHVESIATHSGNLDFDHPKKPRVKYTVNLMPLDYEIYDGSLEKHALIYSETEEEYNKRISGAKEVSKPLEMTNSEKLDFLEIYTNAIDRAYNLARDVYEAAVSFAESHNEAEFPVPADAVGIRRITERTVDEFDADVKREFIRLLADTAIGQGNITDAFVYAAFSVTKRYIRQSPFYDSLYDFPTELDVSEDPQFTLNLWVKGEEINDARDFIAKAEETYINEVKTYFCFYTSKEGMENVRSSIIKWLEAGSDRGLNDLLVDCISDCNDEIAGLLIGNRKLTAEECPKLIKHFDEQINNIVGVQYEQPSPKNQNPSSAIKKRRKEKQNEFLLF